MSDINNLPLPDLIAKVRSQTPALNGGLWAGLLATSGLSPDQLKEQLWASQGVMVVLQGALTPISQPGAVQDATVILVKTATGAQLDALRRPLDCRFPFSLHALQRRPT
jgi:hypothetical protein